MRQLLALAFGVTVWIACVVGASGAWAQETRVFSDIKVQGNSRFTDGQILETSGLLVGQPLGRADLLAAVEALEFTGEFDDIRIFETGDLLVIEVDETPQASGALTGAIGGDSDVGLIGQVDVRLRDAPVLGGEITARLSVAEAYVRARAGVALPRFALNRPGGVEVFYLNEDFDQNRFAFRNYGLEPYVLLQDMPTTRTRLGLFGYGAEMYDVSAEASAILRAEEGRETYAGLSLGHVRRFGGEGGRRSEVSVRQELAFGSEDRSFATTTLGLRTSRPLGGLGVTLATTVEGGGVWALSGAGPRAVDRFTLGGLSLRGFERGSVGPRDVCDACGAGGSAVNERLGGALFAVVRTELQAPLAPQRLGPNFKGFVFADLGSAWGLDTDAAPTGALEDGFDLRLSAGVGLRWESEVAVVELYYGEPVERLDTDQTQRFGFAIRTPF